MRDKPGAPSSTIADIDGWIGFDSRFGRLLAGEVTRTGDLMPGTCGASADVAS